MTQHANQQTRHQARSRAFMAGATSLALALLTSTAISTTALAAQQVGVQAAVRGEVQLAEPETRVVRAAKGGDSVFFLETVTSKADSGLQILLLDETTFTVGPESEIVIDEMVYDPGGESKLIVTVAKGAFRYISGEIAKNNPENVVIKTPSGDIGIRGTSFMAMGNPKTGDWYIGLLGPGPRNNTGDKPGGIVFSNESGSTEVRRSGFGFTVSSNGALSTVEPIPAAVMTEFDNTISGGSVPVETSPTTTTAEAGPAKGGAADGGSAFASTAAASGETTATTQETVTVQLVSESLQSMLANQTAIGATSAAGSSSLTPLTYSELSGYTGQASYTATGVNLYSGKLPNTSGAPTGSDVRVFLESLSGASAGTYDFQLTANFNTKNITGNVTNINVASIGLNGFDLSGFTINSFDVKSGSVNENFNQTNINAGGYDADVNFTFLPGSPTAPSLLTAFALEDTTTKDDVFIGGGIINP